SYDAGQVERIGGANGNEIFDSRSAPDRSHQAYRIRQRKLFSRDPGHKSATANFTACFQAMINAQKYSPRQRYSFSFKQALENPAIALQQNPGHQFAGIRI